MQKVFLGVDVGGTKTAVILSAQPPEALGRIEFLTQPELGPETAINLIVQSARSLLAQHALKEQSIAAIGVSCGSPLDRVRGIVQAPPNLSTWIDLPICKILAEEFHTTCRLENDANAGAVAEHRFGAGRGTENMVFLTLGTGLGAGIIAGGRLYLGANGDAGEIGHVRLSRTGPVGYHKAGSIEGWSSGGGIAQLAVSMLAKAEERGHVSVLHAQLARGLTARDIGLAAHAGDAVARSILRTSGERLGQALAILLDVLNPERIVLGGLAWRMGEHLLAPMRKMVSREALPQTLRACAIVPAALGEKIGDVAAVCVAMGLEDRQEPQARIEARENQ
ncbi:MAG: ROK family protein [Acidobacteriaceae bacterium]